MTPLLPGVGARRVDRCVQHAGRSAANPPHAAAAVERWVRQTDGGTPDRYINPAPLTVRPMSIIHTVYRISLLQSRMSFLFVYNNVYMRCNVVNLTGFIQAACLEILRFYQISLSRILYCFL